jgi:nucleosome binding factor SPN SPT16 subunit
MKVKVEGHDNLVRDVRSKAIINTNTTEYQLYMSRIRAREKQGDAIRNTVKEINDLKKKCTKLKTY